MKSLTVTGLIVGAVVFLAGSLGAERLRFKAELTGAGHQPPVPTGTTGKLRIKFKNGETAVKYLIRLNGGAGITGAHLHCNAASDHPVVATLFGPVPGGVDVNGRLVRSILTDQDIDPACGIANLRELRDAMENGEIYVNVLSMANPSGEIRGQVTFGRKDTDGDGIRDKRDPDIDGDGIANADDPTPYGGVLLAGGPPQGVGGGPPDGETGQSARRAPFWPRLCPKKDQDHPNGCDQPVLLQEWYADLPWTQKLGTYRGNEIDSPFVLPFDALMPNEKRYCKLKHLDNPACMLEAGIVNVLGMKRTDTLYDPTDPKIMGAKDGNGVSYCAADPQRPCIEVKLELSSQWTQSNEEGSTLALVPRPFGKEPQTKAPNTNFDGYYGGYVITDTSTYAPQLPWYTSHYCDADFSGGDTQDPVCYGDYLSPRNNGLNVLGAPLDQWPNTNAPWSVFPSAQPPGPANHCAPEIQENGRTTILTECTLVMAGFDLSPVPEKQENLQYNVIEQGNTRKYNDNLIKWFNDALAKFPDDSKNDTQHFPWSGQTVRWNCEENEENCDPFLYHRARTNPFLGEYSFELVPPNGDLPANCTFGENCNDTQGVRADHYLYPRRCYLSDLTAAARETKGQNGLNTTAVDQLRHCGLNFELHHNGFFVQWPDTYWQDIHAAGGMVGPNQYGRTSFLFSGVPGLHLPVSFLNEEGQALSIYDRVYNASIFSLYMPITNIADNKRAFNDRTPPGRNYQADFYHTLLMSNHNESDPDTFTEGIRGKVLWHNEYRSQKMYAAKDRGMLGPDFIFAAAFEPDKAPKPFHNNTCDGCHVRNGSGVPINTDGELDKELQEKGMKAGKYVPYNPKDYTFTGEIRPMKLVFFDMKRDTTVFPDSSRYTEPMAFPATLFDLLAKLTAADSLEAQEDVSSLEHLYYNNKIMNFYGDSFHVAPVATSGYNYEWYYAGLDGDTPMGEARVDPALVVSIDRHNMERAFTYRPVQASVRNFKTPECHLVPKPDNVSNPWPENCDEVNGAHIVDAINGGEVGIMLLNGKRLGNLSAIEAIPNQKIIDFHNAQKEQFGDKIAGEIIWNAGSRDGVGGEVHRCDKAEKNLQNCYIGRFGWLGDRVSLEDQVANAAYVEQNVLSTEGYKILYPKGNAVFPIRYAHPNCGPANMDCVDPDPNDQGNSDLSEADVLRMAEYARWLGNPTRSEFQVSLPEVIEGEKIFRYTGCSTCHVIDKIVIDKPEDTMLSKVFRDRLATRITESGDAPFLSYIGTDLLMHDMGYLSQVGKASVSIRDADGVVKPEFKNFIQKFRTPALKGLRFNRFVTESVHNTIGTRDERHPACDFLLHDGRACDAIEAAFLHDGPAIKELETIEALNGLTADEIKALRAFLYSL